MIKISSYERKVFIFLLSLTAVLWAASLYLSARDAVDIQVIQAEKAAAAP